MMKINFVSNTNILVKFQIETAFKVQPANCHQVAAGYEFPDTVAKDFRSSVPGAGGCITRSTVQRPEAEGNK